MRIIPHVAAATIAAMAGMRFDDAMIQPVGKRPRTSKTYPHSSARQQARYARQLAAGQITFIKHGPRS